MNTDKLTKFLDIVSKEEKSNAKEIMSWRKANKHWLKKSEAIALHILQHIRSEGITQVDFAQKMNVSPQQISKILKGQENLTLESIAKMEQILGIELVAITKFHTASQYNPVQNLFFLGNSIQKVNGASVSVELNDTATSFVQNQEYTPEIAA
jgi:transcriptional regulator with XRE-family HTH domain